MNHLRALSMFGLQDLADGLHYESHQQNRPIIAANPYAVNRDLNRDRGRMLHVPEATVYSGPPLLSHPSIPPALLPNRQDSLSSFPRSMPSVNTNERSSRPTWSQSGRLETIDLTDDDANGLPCKTSKLCNNLEDKLLHSDVEHLLNHQCAICLDTYRDILKHNKLYTTYCGHVFCKKCIYSALSVSKHCPTCRTHLNGHDVVHPLHLPFI